jgi:hypothetical protein
MGHPSQLNGACDRSPAVRRHPARLHCVLTLAASVNVQPPLRAVAANQGTEVLDGALMKLGAPRGTGRILVWRGHDPVLWPTTTGDTTTRRTAADLLGFGSQ